MTLTVRRLVKNGKGGKTSIGGTVYPNKTAANAATSTKKGETSLPVAIAGRTTDVVEVANEIKAQREIETARALDRVREIGDAAVEIADNFSGGMTGGNSIKSKAMYNSILSEYVFTDIDSNDAIQAGRTKDVAINRIYRDILYHDPICSSGVDLMSTMPFSDFTLTGAKDNKVYSKFEESLQNMNIKGLLPQLSTEYMTHGMFVATTMFDENEGVFVGIVPQMPDYVEITPVPIFGRDPLVTLMVGEAFKNIVSRNDDPRMKEYEKIMTPSQDTLRPEAKDVIYIPRRALIRDYRGVSVFRRLLTSWLLERALYRGTIDQSMKRQRSITHLIMGDTDWTPTQEEMQATADILSAADLDPVGAIFVTRTGVSVNDIRNANDLWKVTDLSDFFMQNKLRSLGISESFLSGDASYNSLEQAMSVFVEQMRSYREMLSYELFYDRTFPRIAATNDFLKRRYGLETAEGIKPVRHNGFGDTRQGKLAIGGSYGGQFFERADGELSREERNNLFIPTVHWIKRLRPEADGEYLGLLATLQENNVPVTLRTWAAAGGLDLDALLNQQNDDMELRKKIKKWMEVIKPPEPGMGGEEGGAGGGAADQLDLSFLTENAMPSRPSIIERFADVDPDTHGMQNVAGGKRHILSKKGRGILEERMNRKVAEVAANLAAVNNRIARLEESKLAEQKTSKTYTA